MLGKRIACVFFAISIFCVFMIALDAAVATFISGALFWMLGVYQTKLESIAHFVEWQKNISARQLEVMLNIAMKMGIDVETKEEKPAAGNQQANQEQATS